MKGKYTFRIFEQGSDINTKDSDTLTVIAENEENALKECLSRMSENYENPEAVLIESNTSNTEKRFSENRDKPAKRTFKEWIDIELTGTDNEELRKDIYEFINYNSDKYSLDDILTNSQFEDILFENGFIGMGHPKWKKPLTEKAIKKTLKEWIDSEMTDEVKEDVYEFLKGSDKYYLDDVLTYDQFEKIMFKNGFDDQGWMWKPLTECECSGDCGGVDSKAFAGQIPENMSKIIQIKKYVESESDKFLDGYTKNKVWPPKIKPKFDINSSRFREAELNKFVESISSDVKEFLKSHPNAKPRDFIEANPDRNLSYQGLVTAFYNARKELGITTTKGRGKVETAAPKKTETPKKEEPKKEEPKAKETTRKPRQPRKNKFPWLASNGDSIKDIDLYFNVDPALKPVWRLLHLRNDGTGTVNLILTNPATHRETTIEMYSFVTFTDSKGVKHEGGVHTGILADKSYPARGYENALPFEEYCKVMQERLNKLSEEWGREFEIAEVSHKGIDQAKLIVQGDYTEKEIINRLLNTGYNEKYLKIIKDKASYSYSYIRWKSGFVEEGQMHNGSGGSCAIRSMADKDFTYVEKGIAAIRKLCKDKNIEITKKGELEYEINLDTYQTPKGIKDIKSAYDFVRFMTDPETKDLRKTIPWEDQIDTLAKFFAGKTIKGTWHDYEWGNKSYYIKFTSQGYTFSRGREEYVQVSWFGVKNKSSEEYEEFQDCSPWYYLRDIMENSGKDCFKPDVILHDMAA